MILFRAVPPYWVGADMRPAEGKLRIADAGQQDIGGHAADFDAGDLHGGEGGFHQGGLGSAVKAGDHDIVGDAESLLFDCVH